MFMTEEQRSVKMMTDLNEYLIGLPLTSRFLCVVNYYTIEINAELNHDVKIEIKILPFDTLGPDYWLVDGEICKGLDQVKTKIVELLLSAAVKG